MHINKIIRGLMLLRRGYYRKITDERATDKVNQSRKYTRTHSKVNEAVLSLARGDARDEEVSWTEAGALQKSGKVNKRATSASSRGRHRRKPNWGQSVQPGPCGFRRGR